MWLATFGYSHWNLCNLKYPFTTWMMSAYKVVLYNMIDWNSQTSWWDVLMQMIVRSDRIRLSIWNITWYVYINHVTLHIIFIFTERWYWKCRLIFKSTFLSEYTKYDWYNCLQKHVRIFYQRCRYAYVWSAKEKTYCKNGQFNINYIADRYER